MSRHKIIYLRYLPLTEKIITDFYFREFSEYGYEVEYWDITTLFFKDIEGMESYTALDSDLFRIVYVKSKSEMKQLIKGNADALFVIMMSYEWRILWIFRYLTIYRCKKAVFAYRPISFGSTGKISKVIHASTSDLIRAFENKILLPWATKTGYIRFYEFCFVAGEDGWMTIGHISKKDLVHTQMFHLNNWDYDKVVKGEFNNHDGGYIAFIDEYYPLHPDGLMFQKHHMDPERYYKELNASFTAFENKYGLPVVIAAHPKALRYHNEDFFEGRKVVFNDTQNVVAEASFILAHDSTALSFAAVFKKPLVFLNSNQIREDLNENYQQIIYLSKYFHSPMLMMDNLEIDALPDKISLTEDLDGVYQSMKRKNMTLLDIDRDNVTLMKKYLKIIFGER